MYEISSACFFLVAYGILIDMLSEAGSETNSIQNSETESIQSSHSMLSTPFVVCESFVNCFPDVLKAIKGHKVTHSKNKHGKQAATESDEVQLFAVTLAVSAMS